MLQTLSRRQFQQRTIGYLRRQVICAPRSRYPFQSQHTTMARPQPPKTTINASCLCNGINFSVTGVDKKAVLCHCNNCKKISGSAFMHNHRFMDAAITYQSGEDMVKMYEDFNTKSGNSLMRHFCGKCGSSLYLTNPKPFPGLVIVCGSSFGDKSQPSFELFAEDKHEWIGEVTPKKEAKM